MFHLIPFPEGKQSQPLHFALAFLGQFLIVALVILLFVLFVALPKSF